MAKFMDKQKLEDQFEQELVGRVRPMETKDAKTVYKLFCAHMDKFKFH